MREHHPLTTLIPTVADETGLSMEIAQAGQPQRPVVLYEGKIIEGRVRERASLGVGVQPQYKDWVLLSDGGDDPLDWMIRTHVETHNPTELERIKIAVAALPYYKARKGQTERLLHKAIGLSWNKIRTLRWLEETNNLDDVLSGEKGIFEAGRELGLVSERRKIALGKAFGRGDRFDEASQPLLRYLRSWKQKKYKFTHVNPTEARRRLKIVDQLIEELQSARADLADRAHDARLSLPSERRTSE